MPYELIDKKLFVENLSLKLYFVDILL